ncbi:MAG: AprI/Inh family metalloprotease inhibitor [Micropepsaceae bacterium]
MSLFQRTLCALAAFAALFAGPVRAQQWQQIQTGAARESAECVSWSDHRMDCFARTFGNGLSWVFVDNNSWNLPRNLGGTLAAPPSCVVRGPNGLNCFAATERGTLATIALNGGAWTKWSSLGGSLLPARVSCVSPTRDQIACYARGMNGQLLERTWNGERTWEPWRNLGGMLSADPECKVVSGSRVACFGRGAKGDLVAFLPDAASTVGGWVSLGGKLEGRPSCTNLASGEVTCMATTAGRELMVWHGTAALGAKRGTVTKLGLQAVGEPTCGASGAGLQCAWRNSRNDLVMASFTEVGIRGETRVFKDEIVLGAKCLSLSPESFVCAVTGKDRTLRYFNSAAPVQVADAAMDVPPPTSVSAPIVPGPASPESAAAKPLKAKTQPDDVSGAWYLTDLASGSQCKVMLAARTERKASELTLAPECKSMGLSKKLAFWERDPGGLHFNSAGRKPRLHFSSASAGQWLSPRRNTALMLSRMPVEKPKGSRTALLQTQTLQVAPQLENGLRGMAGAWRVMDSGAKQVCRIELSSNRHAGGYAVEGEAACPGQYQNVQYWNESGTGLVLVGSGHVVVARFVSAGQDRWRAQSANGVVLVR